MELKIENNGNICLMNLEGEVMIDDIVPLRTKILEAFENAESIIMNFDKVTDADIFALQFLCSAHRTSIALNKKFEIKGSRSDSVKKIIKQSGFRREIGCVHDKTRSCLWIKGE